jgi:hypothetical protein
MSPAWRSLLGELRILSKHEFSEVRRKGSQTFRVTRLYEEHANGD